jgi:hypothetical protein
VASSLAFLQALSTPARECPPCCHPPGWICGSTGSCTFGTVLHVSKLKITPQSCKLLSDSKLTIREFVHDFGQHGASFSAEQDVAWSGSDALRSSPLTRRTSLGPDGSEAFSGESNKSELGHSCRGTITPCAIATEKNADCF